MNVSIRNIEVADLGGVLAVERDSFPDPWEEADFRRALGDKKTVGLLAEVNRLPVGFVIYSLDSDRYRVTSIAVHPEFRRRGVGRQLLSRVAARLQSGRRAVITMTASEENLGSHLFMRSVGFRAVGVPKNYYGPGHDGYEFEFETAGTPVPAKPKSRSRR